MAILPSGMLLMLSTLLFLINPLSKAIFIFPFGAETELGLGQGINLNSISYTDTVIWVQTLTTIVQYYSAPSSN